MLHFMVMSISWSGIQPISKTCFTSMQNLCEAGTQNENIPVSTEHTSSQTLLFPIDKVVYSVRNAEIHVVCVLNYLSVGFFLDKEIRIKSYVNH